MGFNIIAPHMEMLHMNISLHHWYVELTVNPPGHKELIALHTGDVFPHSIIECGGHTELQCYDGSGKGPSLRLTLITGPGVFFLFLCIPHSQKQSAHWAADVTAQVVPCWLDSWLKCNFWPVLRQLPQMHFLFTGLDATSVSSITTVDSVTSSPVNRKSL